MTETTTPQPDPRLVHLARGTMVTYWAIEAPDRVAIVSEHGNRTFGELNARANQLVPRCDGVAWSPARGSR